MPKDIQQIAPEPTTARMALWRARHVELDAEDLTLAQLAEGVRQYVILGAGLDSSVQWQPETFSAGMTMFEDAA
ncbi:MAG TPA: class I SAM-dependent methyltransferase [Novosphingobium sp.]